MALRRSWPRAPARVPVPPHGAGRGVGRESVRPWIPVIGDPGRVPAAAERPSDQVRRDRIGGRVDRVEGFACKHAKAGHGRARIPADLRVGEEEVPKRDGSTPSTLVGASRRADATTRPSFSGVEIGQVEGMTLLVRAPDLEQRAHRGNPLEFERQRPVVVSLLRSSESGRIIGGWFAACRCVRPPSSLRPRQPDPPATAPARERRRPGRGRERAG
jgi:hypothetical protein